MKTKIVTIIMLSIVILCICSANSFALENKGGAGGGSGEKQSMDFSKQINPEDWNPEIYQEQSEKLNTMVGKVLGIIRNIGIIVSVISLMLIGLRTMFGSLEDKSHYKEVLPTFVIGVFIFLSCTTIPEMIYKIFKA